MGVNLRITSGPAIEKPGDSAALLTNLSPGDVLFIDEVHPAAPHGGRNSVSRHGGLRPGYYHREGADGGVLSSAAAAFHADRRHDPGGPASALFGTGSA